MSQRDPSVNNRLQTPYFESYQDMINTQKRRQVQNLFEQTVPKQPSRQEQLAYLDWLEKDFRSDRWLVLRFKQRQPGPRRTQYNRVIAQKKRNRAEMRFNFLLGAILTYPLGLLVGRKFRSSNSGAPAIAAPMMNPYFYSGDPLKKIRYNFYFGLISTCVLGGIVFAYAVKGTRRVYDSNFNRPDLKPIKPFQQNQSDREVDLAHSVDKKFRKEEFWKRFKTTGFYRFWFPKYADWQVRHDTLGENANMVYKGDHNYHGKIDRRSHYWN